VQTTRLTGGCDFCLKCFDDGVMMTNKNPFEIDFDSYIRKGRIGSDKNGHWEIK
jgi:hypothetical protein